MVMKIVVPWFLFSPLSRGISRFVAEPSKSPVGSSITSSSGLTAKALARSIRLLCPALSPSGYERSILSNPKKARASLILSSRSLLGTPASDRARCRFCETVICGSAVGL